MENKCDARRHTDREAKGPGGARQRLLLRQVQPKSTRMCTLIETDRDVDGDLRVTSSVNT